MSFFAADLVAPFCESLREDDIIAEAQPLGNEFSPGEKATFFWWEKVEENAPNLPRLECQ
jgi:hypothetical protein